MQRTQRGVYVERVMGGVVQITAVDRDGEEIYQFRVRASLHEPRFVDAMQQLLDRADPTLKIVDRG